jgi:biopolymer transport protein ExbD
MAAKLSSGGADRYQEDQNSEINVTPFVDVMLVLLIIFMVAAPMAAVTVQVALPPAVAPPSANPPKPVYISLKSNGRIYVQDYASDLATLGDDLRARLGESRNPTKERIFIRADKDVYYGDFMGVMNMLQDNQFYSVALVGEDLR